MRNILFVYVSIFAAGLTIMTTHASKDSDSRIVYRRFDNKGYTSSAFFDRRVKHELKKTISGVHIQNPETNNAAHGFAINLGSFAKQDIKSGKVTGLYIKCLPSDSGKKVRIGVAEQGWRESFNFNGKIPENGILYASFGEMAFFWNKGEENNKKLEKDFVGHVGVEIQPGSDLTIKEFGFLKSPNIKLYQTELHINRKKYLLPCTTPEMLVLRQPVIPAEYRVVNVRIPEKGLQPIHRSLLGVNHSEPTHFFSLNNEEVVRAFKKLRLPLHRFPGGTEANVVSDIDFKPISPEDSYHTNLVGMLKTMGHINEMVSKYGDHDRLDEKAVLDFAKLTAPGAELIRVANIYTGSPEDFLDWFIRTKAFHGSGKMWEMGNEIYLDQYRGAFPSMKDYYKLASNVAGKMREIDPSCKIGAVVTAIPACLKRFDMNQFKDGVENEWFSVRKDDDFRFDRELLPYLASFDAVITHPYLIVEEFAEMPKQDVIDYILTWSEQAMGDSYEYYRKLYPGKEVWITEYNIFNLDRIAFKYFRPNRMITKQGLQALFLVEFISQLLKYPDIFTVAVVHNFADPWGWGLIQDECIKNKFTESGKFNLLSGIQAFEILSDFVWSGEMGTVPEYECLPMKGVRENCDTSFPSLSLNVSYDDEGRPAKILFVNKINSEQHVEFSWKDDKARIGKMTFFSTPDPLPFYGEYVQYLHDTFQTLSIIEKEIDAFRVVVPPYSAGTIEIKEEKRK